jgi:putative membrane protein
MRLSLKPLAVAAAVACVAVVPSSAGAQTVPDITDAQFLATAAQANRFEIVTGRLAEQRGRSSAVRRLGRQFARHHSMQLEQGSAVADRLGISLPSGLNPQQQRDVQRLRARHGRRFDSRWLRVQRIVHERATTLHLRGALTGDSADVRELATLALPLIGMHHGAVLEAVRHRRGG